MASVRNYNPASAITPAAREQITKGVFHKSITPIRPSIAIYAGTSKALKEALYKGYGGRLSSFTFDSPDYKMLQELRTNIYMFSAAKSFQQTLQMTDMLRYSSDMKDLDLAGKYKLGDLLSYEDYHDAVKTVFSEFDDRYLSTEYYTTVGMARSAAKWNNIISHGTKMLTYSAVMDEHTCEICAPLDGITRPVGDPFWDTNMPLNHYLCECVVIEEEDDEEPTPDDYTDEHVEQSHDTKNKLFNFNPGKDKKIFQDTGRYKHPYFEIPKKYAKLAQLNFNFHIPQHDS